MPPLPRPSPSTLVRGGLLAVAVARIARGARRAASLRPVAADEAAPPVTVIVPARDEAARIGPCLRSLAGSDVTVVVVDDGSTDGTRQVAEDLGAQVIDAGPLPVGWAGKTHALQVGLEAARTDVVISIDADCRVEPGFVPAMVAALGERTMISAGTAVAEPGASGRLVHASMLATLVYRLGPPGVAARRPSRTMANGQCMAFARRVVLDAGGFGAVSASLVEDLALARNLAADGHTVAFLDATRIITVDGYGGAAATMRGWGRSLSLREVTPMPALVADLAVVWSAMALPLPRLLRRRADGIDLAAIALRLGVVAATAPAFRHRGAPIVLAPLADLPVAVWLTIKAVRPSTRWRGRDYG